MFVAPRVGESAHSHRGQCATQGASWSIKYVEALPLSLPQYTMRGLAAPRFPSH